MDIITTYRIGLEQLKETKAFLMKMNPVDYELKSMIHTIDQKINKTEQSLHSFQAKAAENRCGLCDRAYDEEEPKSVGNVKICPYCRSFGQKFRSSGDMEKKYQLSQGTIKRDCIGKSGNPPKLQPYLDCGLVYKTGAGYMVHELVMEQYYSNSEGYRRRKTKNSGI